ncbi:MAG TPA: hypothetical protein VFW83_08305, partial [Bryobacteraceae bacterium]|nr:hypothetical protein [Bryobacteraceae bacterium]
MSILFGAIFLILFAIVLVAISLGMRFLEDQRKRQVKGMLSAVSGEDSEPQQTSILREEEDPLDVFLKKAAFGRRLESAIRLAGLEWTVGKLVMLMLLFGAAGGILGGLFNPFGILWLSIVVPA